MSTQMPSGVRNTVADALGIAREQARVVVGDVGGGFGMKTGAYLEDVALAHAAHQLRRSVKWVADRSEEFLSTYHGRDVQTHAELALDEGAASSRCASPRRPTWAPTLPAPAWPSSC